MWCYIEYLRINLSKSCKNPTPSLDSEEMSLFDTELDSEEMSLFDTELDSEEMSLFDMELDSDSDPSSS
jgi:hypothetical protein